MRHRARHTALAIAALVTTWLGWKVAVHAAQSPQPAPARVAAVKAGAVKAGAVKGAAPVDPRALPCDDLDPASLVQAIEAQLPSLLPAQSPPPYSPVTTNSATSTNAATSAATSTNAAASSNAATATHSADSTGASTATRLPVLGGQTLAEYAQHTLQPLLALARRGRTALCRGFPRQFRLVRVADANQGHVTAYYHPVVRGSRTARAPYTQPLYRRPPEPQSQLSSADILAGGLDKQGLELVFVDSLYSALNIHIEGSATIQLIEGGEINLTPDGHNGQPYTNPFKLARADHVVPADQPTTPGQSRTHSFFLSHPDVLRSYWSRNPHFVFFKETPLRGSGRFGQLVAGRSIAVDSTLLPLGVALWLRSEVATGIDSSAAGEQTQFSPIARVTLAQDTGAAIRGRGRVDLFVGSGPGAQLAAARTSRPGELFLILHKQGPKPTHQRSHRPDRPPPSVPRAQHSTPSSPPRTTQPGEAHSGDIRTGSAQRPANL